MKSFLFSLLLATILAAVSPSVARASDVSATSATFAVFFAHGVATAAAETAPPTMIRSFRGMAHSNALIADLLEYGGHVLAAAYFRGRAAAFHDAANLAGEP